MAAAYAPALRPGCHPVTRPGSWDKGPSIRRTQSGSTHWPIGPGLWATSQRYPSGSAK